METHEEKIQNMYESAEKLAGMNHKLDDMLSELGALKDLMPSDYDLENLQKYNMPVSLPPMNEEKEQEYVQKSSDLQHANGNKKTE
ncbi:hypothetical protein KC19_11G059500 [Ceratodon purpureus]|uniref:Uncharacterized protein n=1 Tax=Ceratodon purpureus TaxID=3225 RepID=A0A8T0GDB6_CERPU|nr:hypothetical protein KC19_11G059500 [Ceratodon purpureus]KAG0556517.1 hypothetical protein KC19_11G059500 [Ceratodon purpureus]